MFNPFKSLPIVFQRHIAMLELIPHYPDFIPTSILCEKLKTLGFDIEIRSVQRDLETLKEAFNLSPDIEEIPIDDTHENGKRYKSKGQWHFKKNSLPVVLSSFDDQTAISFMLIQSYLKSIMPPEALDKLDPWFKKSAQRLSKRKTNTAKWQEKIYVLTSSLPRIPPNINTEVQRIVYKAVLDELPIKLVHKARGAKEPKEHFVSPLGIVVKDAVSYLIATHNRKQDILQFALHRTVSASLDNDNEFIHPIKPYATLKNYAVENLGYPVNDPSTLNLKIHITSHSVTTLREYPFKNQNIVDGDDGIILSAVVPNNRELRQWIRSLGLEAEVLEPISLRNEIKHELTKLSARYK